MDPDALSDDEAAKLAHRLAPHLPTGTHGDRVILPRRAFIAGAVGTLSAGALMALGVDEAAAQAAGQQGTPQEPNNMYAYDLNVANAVTSSLPMNGNDIENAGAVSAEKLDRSSGYEWTEKADRSFDEWVQAPADKDIEFGVVVNTAADSTEVNLLVDINTTESANNLFRERDTLVNTGDDLSVGPFTVPAGHYYQVRAFGDTADYVLDTWAELS